MEKYACSICGYVYDEAKGIPEAGIAPGTKWEDLPNDWVCPLCGASKSEFEKQGAVSPSSDKQPRAIPESSTDFQELSALEVSALCTNLARGCEKQYRPEEAEHFKKLAVYFKGVSSPAESPDFSSLLALIEEDLKEGLEAAHDAASAAGDRGALRALVWSGKVTRILKSLLARYQKEGDGIVDNTGVYVCTICGFVYVGDKLPEVCPVCKVPNWKFEKIEGRQ